MHTCAQAHAHTHTYTLTCAHKHKPVSVVRQNRRLNLHLSPNLKDFQSTSVALTKLRVPYWKTY